MTEIIVRFPTLSEKEKQMIYGYQGDIIRCRDCVNLESGSSALGKWCYCRISGMNIEPDEYCSWAERRQHETD